jgi:hypothetical protein
MLAILLLAIVVLYWRTLKYNYLIDDAVKRNGYLYEAPVTAPPADIYKQRPSAWYRLFMIGMHCVNTSIIFLLWGWGPALLFAVHPVGVWGTVWVTGNYYATTLYFMLISYYILHVFPNVIGFSVAASIYVAALNSTICALPFPVFLIATGNWWGIPMFFPVWKFMSGRRFQTGYKKRSDFVKEHRVKTPFRSRRLILMTKVMAYYTYTVLFPDRLFMFTPFGENVHDDQKCYDLMHKADWRFWSSFILCLTVLGAGMVIHPVGTLWYFLFMGLHSQFKIMGQFIALRYVYVSMVGMCVVFGTVLQSHPILMTIAVTYLVIRTHYFIPAFSNMENLWKNDLGAFPHSAMAWNNVAAYYMNLGTEGNNASWKINRLAFYIIKAYEMNPNKWEITMNMACFYAIMGQWPMCLKYTDKAIELLEPVADKPTSPLQQMYRQRERIIKMAEEAVKQPEGATLSPSNCSEEQKVGRENGTRQGVEDTVEHNGNGVVAGREA